MLSASALPPTETHILIMYLPVPVPKLSVSPAELSAPHNVHYLRFDDRRRAAKGRGRQAARKKRKRLDALHGGSKEVGGTTCMDRTRTARGWKTGAAPATRPFLAILWTTVWGPSSKANQIMQPLFAVLTTMFLGFVTLATIYLAFRAMFCPSLVTVPRPLAANSHKRRVFIAQQWRAQVMLCQHTSMNH